MHQKPVSAFHQLSSLPPDAPPSLQAILWVVLCHTTGPVKSNVEANLRRSWTLSTHRCHLTAFQSLSLSCSVVSRVPGNGLGFSHPSPMPYLTDHPSFSVFPGSHLSSTWNCIVVESVSKCILFLLLLIPAELLTSDMECSSLELPP